LQKEVPEKERMSMLRAIARNRIGTRPAQVLPRSSRGRQQLAELLKRFVMGQVA
jgi:hypothetical protein